DRRQLRGAAVAVHDVSELVVAVHEAGDVVDRPMPSQPRRRFGEARQLATLDALEEGGPAIDLPLVEAVRPAEVLQALRVPVDVAEQSDALDELIRQSLAGLEVGVEGGRPRAPLDAHR